MATGHTHEGLRPGPEIIRGFMTDPRVAAFLKIKPSINRSFDIPYLGGYSRDGRTIYIDRHLPGSIVIAGKSVNVIPFIVTHEHTEKALIDALGLRYQPAHVIATEVEHEQVRRTVDVGPYERALKPFIKADELERIRNFPPDVDLTPYLDSNDTKVLVKIRSVLNKANWQAALAGKIIPKDLK